MNIGKVCLEALKDIADLFFLLLSFCFAKPEEIKEHIVNREPVSEYEGPRPDEVVPASVQLAQTARGFIGKDASPKNRAPQELSCAEGIVNIINTTWPETLDEKIVGTDELDHALLRSKRFKGVLDPIEGDVIVFPRTATVHGHALICVAIEKEIPIYASNDSLQGIFQKNYTRFTARREFITNRGLRGHIWRAVDIGLAEDPHERDN